MMTIDARTMQIMTVWVTLALPLAPAPAGAEQRVGQLTATGMVKINGKPATTGDIVAKGSEVQTAKGSSAEIDLGELGRVEALPSTTLRLRYDETVTTHTPASVAILLLDGSIRATNGEGIRLNVESGTATARPSSLNQQNVFTVDASCGNTAVSVAKGKVELRIGDNVRQIDAGDQERAGPAKPGCTPSR